MYNLITATENETINNELKKTQKYNILFSDIAYQEALIEIIENKLIDKVLVYENLPGGKKKEDFFKTLIENKKETEFIVIVDKIDNKTKDFFHKYNISKLIDSKNITVENINKTIDEKNIIIKREEKKEAKKDFFNILGYDKKVTTVSGNNGAGKTTFASNLAIALAKNTNKKVLLIDLDTINANVETFLDIPKINNKTNMSLEDDKLCVLNAITEYIQKNTFNFDMFSKLVIPYNRYKNLDVITGNTSMFVCQNVLCENYYNLILEKANQLYEYIVIDTNSSLFLDSTKWAIQKSDITYFVLEGTYRDLKNFKNSLAIFAKAWDVLISKLKIVLNKTNSFSLNSENVKNIINIDVIGEFPYSQDYIKTLNNGMPVILYNKTILAKYEKIIGAVPNKKSLLEIIGGKIVDNKSIKNK